MKLKVVCLILASCLSADEELYDPTKKKYPGNIHSYLKRFICCEITQKGIMIKLRGRISFNIYKMATDTLC